MSPPCPEPSQTGGPRRASIGMLQQANRERISLVPPLQTGPRRASIGMKHSSGQSGSQSPPRKASFRGSVNATFALGRLTHDAVYGRGSRTGSPKVSSKVNSPSEATSLRHSRSNSRSEANSRSNSRGRDARSNSHSSSANEDSGAGGILQLKGLPSQDEILARKQFRAISVDLSDTPLDLGEGHEGRGSSSDNATHQLPEIAVARQATEPLQEAKIPRTSRSVKRAQDTDVMVSDAITKLAALDADRGGPS